MDIYHDPNPPKWPNNRIPFNRWNTGLHAFLYQLQKNFDWGSHRLFGKVKYLNIRVDTRNGNFIVFRENDSKTATDEVINPDDLGLTFAPVHVYPDMQHMSSAPKDRDILILTFGYTGTDKNSCVVARYYKDETTEEFYVGNDWSIDVNSKTLLGWWELPK